MEDNMQIMIRMIVRSIQTYLRPQVYIEHLFRLDTNHNEIGHTIGNAYI